MAKSKIDVTRTAHGTDKSKHPSQSSPGFFNPTVSSNARKRKRDEAAAPPPTTREIRLTTTEFLLMSILEELKLRNQIELMKLKIADDKEQAEMEALKEKEERDQAHFESEIRPAMFM
ncbi:hypothetical protein [Legionella sp. km772]|uniref:hypothetical protein n=1 Tax=Legionella sp. km772 TaxID=2498111 RepID=UPI000F8D4EAD|nr:hypothetical protein [Legionella sp. km772]RUR12052.1 hypothetical protein ELY15_06305 [Legionella sp. km772]